MILLWLLCVSLVLGGVLVNFWLTRGLRIPWLQKARVPARVCRSVLRQNPGASRYPDHRDLFLPPPRVIARAGPRPRSVE